MSASLGGLLKDYRLQKNVSQMEIAFALGWKDGARISRIEQGHIEKPDRDLIEKICLILELKPQESNSLLLVGGFLPTQKEITYIRKKTHSLINSWNYPVGVRDFSWRIIHANSMMIKFHNMNEKQQRFIVDECPSVIEITFNAEYELNNKLLIKTNKELSERKRFLTTMLKDFKYHQRHRTRERWYVDFVRRMMNNPLFRETWMKTEDIVDPDLDLITNFAIKRVPSPINRNDILSTFIIITPYREDPRFEIEFHIPADTKTFNYFESIKN